MQLGFSRRNALRQAPHNRPVPKRRRFLFDALEDRRLLSGGTLVASGSEFQVSDAGGVFTSPYTPPNSSPRDVAMDSAGNAAAVWMSPDANGDGNVTLNYQYYTNNSGTLTPTFGGNVATGVVPSSKGNAVGFPPAIQVAMAPGSSTTPGEFVVLWQTPGETSKGQTTFTTYVQVFNPATEKQATAPITVGSGNNWAISVAMNANGFDVLYDALSRTWAQTLTLQRYTSAGQTEGRAISITATSLGRASMSMDAQGNFVVVGDSSTGTDAQRYSSTGQAQGSVIEVNTPSTAGNYSNVSMDPSTGDFVVAWQQRVPDPITGKGSNVADLYARQFLANGTPVETDSVITVATPTFATYTWLNPPYTVFDEPSSGMELNTAIGLAALPGSDGAFDITWTNLNETVVPTGSTTGSGYHLVSYTDIYAQSYDSSGAQTQALAVTSDGTSGGSSAAVDGNNDLLVVFQDSGNFDGQFYLDPPTLAPTTSVSTASSPTGAASPSSSSTAATDAVFAAYAYPEDDKLA